MIGLMRILSSPHSFFVGSSLGNCEDLQIRIHVQLYLEALLLVLWMKSLSGHALAFLVRFGITRMTYEPFEALVILKNSLDHSITRAPQSDSSQTGRRKRLHEGS